MTDKELLQMLFAEDDPETDDEAGEALDRLLAAAQQNIILCPPGEDARPVLVHLPVDPFVGRIPLPVLSPRRHTPAFRA